ncbi:MAG: tRNA lysidine(34) synthetase TilS [Proteobacteria bacterium]|nr:tRNA lysidine(34) synthetase TilS [Pseudomonadota bacterium]
MALLEALKILKNECRISLWAAHYNHRLRGDESEQEAKFVKRECERIAIPFISETDDGSLFQQQSNLEENARRKRYSFFQKAALEIGAQKVALGHTANDQVETFFIWLLRGTGTTGLGGIPPVRQDIFIRPLIEISREEIIEFLRAQGIMWIEDPSNQGKRYLRNRIRNHLIPELLHEFNGNFFGNILKTTEILRDEDQFLEKFSKKQFQQLINKDSEKGVCLKISELKKLPIALKRRIIRHAIREVKGSLRRINFAHVESILTIMKNNAPNLKVSLPDAIEAVKEYDNLRVTGVSLKTHCFYHEFMSLPKEIRIPEIDQNIEVKVLDWKDAFSPKTSKNFALIDFDKVKFPLIVRNWHEGDRFQPLGTKGFKKVRDFFIDIKLPRGERENTPLILFGDCIAWIGGQRIDDRVKITNSTNKILRMEIN